MSSKTRKPRFTDIKDAKIGFIGAGKMTESIILGLINVAKLDPKKMFVAAPSDRHTAALKELGVNVTKRNIDIFGRFDTDFVFINVHGCVINKCFKMGGTIPAALTTNFIPNMRHQIYMLSMVSGIEIPKIKQVLLDPENPGKYSIEAHRITLNPAVSTGCGVGAIDCELDSKKLGEPVKALLSCIARLEYIPEAQMDAACAIVGSGLSFSHYLVGSLADGAVKMGLQRATANKLAAKTALCASQALLESGKHPNELRDLVCSPKGAAIYGCSVLDKADCASGIQAAVEAAHKRAQELLQC